MLTIDQIRSLHLELTTACNAQCPSCPRNVAGFTHNDGYPECDLTLDQCKTILTPDFLKQIRNVYISGNFGDFIMNPQSIEILTYLRSEINQQHGYIIIGTNGGARSSAFWKKVANLSNEVVFCIDGLEDTHSIYRRNTLFNTVLQNANTVIQSGGKATWKFIVFEHNKHQIEEAQARSKELGFSNFLLHNAQHENGRHSTPVFDRHGDFEYYIGQRNSNNPIPIQQVLFSDRRVQSPDINKIACVPANNITCDSLAKKEIYITANGEVYPCCFMGHYPKTFQTGMNTWYGTTGLQLENIVRSNNALEHGLEKSIEWFNSIPPTWDKPDWGSGRLLVCDNSCSHHSPYSGDQIIKNDI